MRRHRRRRKKSYRRREAWLVVVVGETQTENARELFKMTRGISLKVDGAIQLPGRQPMNELINGSWTSLACELK